MLKIIALITLGAALACGTSAVASPRVIVPAAPYVFPGAEYGYPDDGMIEGRSIYRMEDPSTFWGGSDEKGYPSGDPQNPRSGD
ncbi:hypothetical protein QEV83_13540 [Methylocapsa sp. D3K7]|uniref:hypothetical protein n=1 Tax=Methylocapsa sp. D3K7 TaxID=3041435 RepID=UPI00244E93F6|nr:hypothetical protein [Methylocapsa sp. D3K7]WGJ13704.1 hypothetical protein QEV83_13540 [Methylocapsa sp. D3K7]